MLFVWIHVVHAYSSTDTTAALKKSHSILSDRSDFHMIESLSIAVHVFAWQILISVSIDETLIQLQLVYLHELLCIVGVRYSFCGISSASCYFYSKAVFF